MGHNMPKYELDDIDRRIIETLQKEGRLSNHDLADRVGLSPSPCLRRVKRLESEGVIDKYVALVNPEALGLMVTAFVRVRLGQQTTRHLARFEEAMAACPEVMECYLMSGDSDYQLRVVVGSLREFEDFLRARITPLESVSQIQSSFALRPIVYRTELPAR